MTTDDAEKNLGRGFSKLGRTRPTTPWNPLEALRSYKDGLLWTRLNQIETDESPSDELPSLTGPFPRTLYHYTDIQGLRGILESNSLRASAAYYLNDSSEIEYGSSLLLNELAPWVEANTSRKSVAADVVRSLHGYYMHPHSKLSRSSNIYVACFCENDNLLCQWRAYRQRGGYALGFRNTIHATLKSVGPYDLKLARVVYQEEAQVQQIRSLLRETILAVDSEFGPDPISNPNLFNDIVVMIQELLLDEIVRFKHPAFVDEREWRLVARFDFRRTRPTTKSSSGSLFQFRSSGGYVVPFIQLKPTKGKIPLTSVRFGPSLDFNVMRAR